MTENNTSSEKAEASSRELQDKAYKDWERIRSIIEHENSLINYRLTWLIVPQGFLIQGFGNTLNILFSRQNPVSEEFSVVLYLFLTAISSLLVVFCWLILNSIKAAEDYLKEIDQWWYWKLKPTSKRNKDDWKNTWEDKETRNKLIKENLDEHPPLQGWTERSSFGLHYPFAPGLFMIFWLLALVFSLINLIIIFIIPIVFFIIILVVVTCLKVR